MKSRFEILPIYSNFAKMVETQFSKRIKTFQSDNALEYTQYVFQALLHSYGTVHHLTCLGTSQQNDRAERKLRHILDTVFHDQRIYMNTFIYRRHMCAIQVSICVRYKYKCAIQVT